MLLLLIFLSFIYEYGLSVMRYLTVLRIASPHNATANVERGLRRTPVTIASQRGYVWMTDEKNYR